MTTTIESASAAGSMSGEEIVSLSREYTLYEWSAQSAVDPIPVERAEGVYFYSPDGTRYLDFNSAAHEREHRPRRSARHPRDPGAG